MSTETLFPWHFALSALVLGIAAITSFRAYRNRPRFRREDMAYQEWGASGCSEANGFTRWMWSRRTIRLVVTNEILWVTSYFPFSLFSALSGLEQVIPLGAIEHIEPGTLWLHKGLRVVYRDGEGTKRSLFLVPRDPVLFLRHLRYSIESVE